MVFPLPCLIIGRYPPTFDTFPKDTPWRGVFQISFRRHFLLRSGQGLGGLDEIFVGFERFQANLMGFNGDLANKHGDIAGI